MQILYLFRGECMGNQPIGAQAHAVVLPWIERARIAPATAIQMMTVAMFSDTEMACKGLHRTLLDFEYWLSLKLKDFWEYSETFLPSAPSHVCGHLHPILANSDKVVCGAMRRLRRCLHWRDSVAPTDMHPPTDHASGDLAYSWMASRTLHDVGLLVNYVVSLIAAREDQGDDEGLCGRNVRAAIALATLYNVRKFLHESNFNGVDLREAPLIVLRLEEALKLALKSISAEEKVESGEVLLWMYFTGAWHEQKVRQRHKSSAVHSNLNDCAESLDAVWFKTQLAKQAVTLRVTKWSDARHLLSRMAFSDIMRPHPSAWYEKVLKEHAGLGVGDDLGCKAYVQRLAKTPRDGFRTLEESIQQN